MEIREIVDEAMQRARTAEPAVPVQPVRIMCAMLRSYNDPFCQVLLSFRCLSFSRQISLRNLVAVWGLGFKSCKSETHFALTHLGQLRTDEGSVLEILLLRSDTPAISTFIGFADAERGC